LRNTPYGITFVKREDHRTKWFKNIFFAWSYLVENARMGEIVEIEDRILFKTFTIIYMGEE